MAVTPSCSAVDEGAAGAAAAAAGGGVRHGRRWGRGEAWRGPGGGAPLPHAAPRRGRVERREAQDAVLRSLLIGLGGSEHGGEESAPARCASLHGREESALASAASATALHRAAVTDDAPAIDAALAAGDAVDSRTDGGVTPLALAARAGATRAAEKLIAAGADVDSRTDAMQMTPLQ